jgi:hypothetical protein
MPFLNSLLPALATRVISGLTTSSLRSIFLRHRAPWPDSFIPVEKLTPWGRDVAPQAFSAGPSYAGSWCSVGER